MKNAEIKEIKEIIKKLGNEKKKVLKICNEVSNKVTLKEELMPYISVLTDDEIEKLCTFFTSETELSSEELAAVSGGKIWWWY